MLVLSRRIDEEIIIGENVRVRIVKVRGKTVRLGIVAPEDINVRRAELPAQELDTRKKRK